MKNYLFIDIFTQKGFVENFGSAAIEDCSSIRESLMDVTEIAIKSQIPITSLMYMGFNGNDFDKIADTQTEQSGVDNDALQHLYQVQNLNCSDCEINCTDKILFVYGVPFESAVVQFCTRYIEKCKQLWIVEDAVKAIQGDPMEILASLKQIGCKKITARNLEKFINM